MARSITPAEEKTLMDDFFATVEFVPQLDDQPEPDDDDDDAERSA